MTISCCIKMDLLYNSFWFHVQLKLQYNVAAWKMHFAFNSMIKTYMYRCVTVCMYARVWHTTAIQQMYSWSPSWCYTLTDGETDYYLRFLFNLPIVLETGDHSILHQVPKVLINNLWGLLVQDLNRPDACLSPIVWEHKFYEFKNS